MANEQEHYVVVSLSNPDGETIQAYCPKSENFMHKYQQKLMEEGYTILNVEFSEEEQDLPYLADVIAQGGDTRAKQAEQKQKVSQNEKPVEKATKAKPKKVEPSDKKTIALDGADKKNEMELTGKFELPKEALKEDTKKRRKLPSEIKKEALQATPRKEEPQKPKAQKATPKKQATIPSTTSAMGHGISDDVFDKLQKYRKKKSNKFGLASSFFKLLLGLLLLPKMFTEEINYMLAKGGVANIVFLLVSTLAGIGLVLIGHTDNPETFNYLGLTPFFAVLPVSSFMPMDLSPEILLFVDHLITILAFSLLFTFVMSVVGCPNHFLVTFFSFGMARMLMSVFGWVLYSMDESISAVSLIIFVSIASLYLAWKLVRSLGYRTEFHRTPITIGLFVLFIACSIPIAANSNPWRQIKGSMLGGYDKLDDQEMLLIITQFIQSENGRKLVDVILTTGTTLTNSGLVNNSNAASNFDDANIDSFLGKFRSQGGTSSNNDLLETIRFSGKSGGGIDPRELFRLADFMHQGEIEFDNSIVVENTKKTSKTKLAAEPEPQKATTGEWLDATGLVKGAKGGQTGEDLEFTVRLLSMMRMENHNAPHGKLYAQWDYDYDGKSFQPTEEENIMMPVSRSWSNPGNYTVAVRIKEQFGGYSQPIIKKISIVQSKTKLLPEKKVVLLSKKEKVSLSWKIVPPMEKFQKYALEIDINPKKMFKPDVTLDSISSYEFKPKKSGLNKIKARVRISETEISEENEISVYVGRKAIRSFIKKQKPFLRGTEAELFAVPQKGATEYEWSLKGTKKGLENPDKTTKEARLLHVFDKSGQKTIAYRAVLAKGKKGKMKLIKVRVDKPLMDAKILETPKWINGQVKDVQLKGKCLLSGKRVENVKVEWDTNYNQKTFNAEIKSDVKEIVEIKKAYHRRASVAFRCIDSSGQASELAVVYFRDMPASLLK